MNVDELMQIVQAEQLDTPVLYGVGRLHLDAVVLEGDGATWSVYLVDERTQPFESTRRMFDSESAALEHVLRKLRQVEKARRSMAAMSARSGFGAAKPSPTTTGSQVDPSLPEAQRP